MSDEHDEFEGIDISGPWGGLRIGSGRFRNGGVLDADPEYRRIRRRVRRRLDFYRHVMTYVLITGGLALLDWLTGGGWWVQVGGGHLGCGARPAALLDIHLARALGARRRGAHGAPRA